MILSIVYFCLMLAKEGILSPYKNDNLHLSVMPDTSLRFMDVKKKDKRKGDIVVIDTEKFKIKIDDKPICKVEENSPLVSTCTDKIRFIDWQAVGEDGNWKFVTDDNLCLTVGGLDKKSKGYFVHAVKCDHANDNQKFSFTSTKKNPSSFAGQMNEFGKGNILELYRLITDREKVRKVLITVKDDKNDKYYTTDTKELNNLLASGNHVKLMDHDFLVDSGITAEPKLSN